MSKEIIKDSILPILFIIITISSFYYKSPFAVIWLASLVTFTIPVIYKVLNYYNRILYILISAVASIGGVIMFCLYSDSINILTIFMGSIFPFIAFYEAYKISKAW